ncbi:hypothetical protein EVG20_g2287 [Dentipellis fragilis]|uniref:MYND-type domain-containing protein n=1 Tax=Dentipellis fragilis TaxID=205917 RepID=A0A4Y9ZA78_9AGAM|nr:hypothetical protein EVG20_g2287 [Dentipellis fragilis]
MPVIDSSLEMVVTEPHPERRCFWEGCTRDIDDETKTKACSRCKLSRSCQQADWTKHKTVCQEPQYLDFGTWLKDHEVELKWAAAQALGGYKGPNLTSTHCLMVRILRSDRLPVGTTPGPFVIVGADALALEKLARITPAKPEDTMAQRIEALYPQIDHAESAEVRRDGGLGIALIAFLLHGMPRKERVFMFRRFTLGRPAPAYQRYIPKWEWAVQSLVNGRLDDPVLLDEMKNALLPVPSSEGSDPDQAKTSK